MLARPPKVLMTSLTPARASQASRGERGAVFAPHPNPLPIGERGHAGDRGRSPLRIGFATCRRGGGCPHPPVFSKAALTPARASQATHGEREIAGRPKGRPLRGKRAIRTRPFFIPSAEGGWRRRRSRSGSLPQSPPGRRRESAPSRRGPRPASTGWSGGGGSWSASRQRP